MKAPRVLLHRGNEDCALTMRPLSDKILAAPGEIADTLHRVEQALADSGPRAHARAAAELSHLESRLRETPETSVPLSLRIAIITARGHLERARENFPVCVRAYRSALSLAESLPHDGDQRVGNLLVYLGLAYLSVGDSTALAEAVCVFDRAIAVRTRHGIPTDLAARWALAAAWMNRGDALLRLGNETRIRAAIDAQDRAIDLLTPFDLDANPSYRSRLALAWMNRGEAFALLPEHCGHATTEPALKSFQKGIDILRHTAERGIPESRRTLAILLSNLARVRLRLRLRFGSGHDPEAGVREATEALELLSGDGFGEDLDLRRLDLSIRVILCRLALSFRNNQGTDLTDLVEIGLAPVLRDWSAGGLPNSLRPSAIELFRCGAEIYRRNLPQFLADYLLDHLDPDRGSRALAEIPDCHRDAVETLWRATGELQRKGFAGADGQLSIEYLDRQAEWHRCRRRLAEIRAALEIA